MTPKSSPILVLGGTGKVGGRLTPLLHEAGFPFIVATRSGNAPEGYETAIFDWDNESTWEGVFTRPISAVYVVAASTAAQPTVKKLIDLARSKGVPRFVLLSASSIEEGGPLLGDVHKYLRELGDEGKIEWTVLRPTWFQENFLTGVNYSALKENKLYSGTGSGRIPWVSAHDIAAVAFHALTTPKAFNKDLIITGPELLAYDDLARIFSEVLGRTITYHDISEQELAAKWIELGLVPAYANVLAAMDTEVRRGSEDRLSDVVRTVTGREPRYFRKFVKENKEAWL